MALQLLIWGVFGEKGNWDRRCELVNLPPSPSHFLGRVRNSEAGVLRLTLALQSRRCLTCTSFLRRLGAASARQGVWRERSSGGHKSICRQYQPRQRTTIFLISRILSTMPEGNLCNLRRPHRSTTRARMISRSSRYKRLRCRNSAGNSTWRCCHTALPLAPWWPLPQNRAEGKRSEREHHTRL